MKTTTEEVEWLIRCITTVESGGNPDAIGDNGLAIGALQITEPVVADFNAHNVLQFTHRDMFDPEKAFIVCRWYLLFYANAAYVKHDVVPEAEVMARIWNGGPDGYAKPATKKYWQRIKDSLPEN